MQPTLFVLPGEKLIILQLDNIPDVILGRRREGQIIIHLNLANELSVLSTTFPYSLR